MLLSNDGTKAFVCVPKTGSTTITNVLLQYCGAKQIVPPDCGENYDVVSAQNHWTVEDNYPRIRARFPNVPLESIKAYAFFRDPVERWCSAVDYWYKRRVSFLSTLVSVKSDVARMRFLKHDMLTFENRVHIDGFQLQGQPENLSTKMIREFYSYDVLQEMAMVPWDRFPVNPHEHEFFFPQSQWLKQPNTTILDYSNFNSELERLINEWCIPHTYYQPADVPHKNVSEIRRHPVSDSTRKRIREAYAEDYELMGLA